MKKLLCILILALGCGPSTINEFRREGEAIAIALAKELQKVETAMDLEELSPKIKKKLNRLTDLMVASQNISDERPKAEPFGSQLLKKELERIYTIEGGKEGFESICADALVKVQLNLH